MVSVFRTWSVIFLLFIIVIFIVVIHLFNHHFYLIAIIIIIFFFLVVIVFLLAITLFFTLRWRCRLRGRLSGFSERLAGSGPFGVAAPGLHGRPSFVGVIVIVFCFIDGKLRASLISIC
jgi:thiol:disulfide interchange protein